MSVKHVNVKNESNTTLLAFYLHSQSKESQTRKKKKNLRKQKCKIKMKTCMQVAD